VVAVSLLLIHPSGNRALDNDSAPDCIKRDYHHNEQDSENNDKLHLPLHIYY